MKNPVGKFIVFVLLALCCTSCFFEEVEYTQVDFKPVQGTCLVDSDRVTRMVIYNQSEFAGKFTGTGSVDFGENFIISVCLPVSQKRTDVTITEILTAKSILYVMYKIDERNEPASQMHPHSTVAVSRNYAGYDVSFQNITGME